MVVGNRRRKAVGGGTFARRCLAAASKHCKGQKGAAFHACRRAFIAKCK